jgi:hypothetical protein
LKSIISTLFLLLLYSCSNNYVNNDVTKKKFPSAQGTSLANKSWNIPKDFTDDKTILLLGYKKDSQFDIDRWLIGLDMKKVKTKVYEIPTIKGLFPRVFKTKIDSGMRRGIPKELWGAVITIYKDGDNLQKFTGNIFPNNARVILLDKAGNIVFFDDKGFSISALNKLIDAQ